MNDPIGDFTFDLGDDGSSVAEPEHLDPSEGEWVFKQDGVVLGPVSAAILLQRIDEGELDADTPVGRSAGDWSSLQEVPYFFKAYRRAEARIKRIEAAAAHERAMRSRTTVRMASFAGLAIVPLLLGAVAGRTVMVARPWDDSGDWVQRAPPLVDLAPKPKAPPPPPPVEKPKPDDEKKDDTVASANPDGDKKDPKDKRKRKKRRKTAKKDDKKDDGTKDKVVVVKKAGGTLSNDQVTAGFKKGFGDYKRCIKNEFKRDKELGIISVKLEFTITETGRAINTRVRERQFRNGPLNSCLVKAVSKIRWPKFSGERRNATFPLRAKRP